MSAYQYVYHMDGVSKTYPGGKKCFENIHLSFLPGVKIGVVGVNGSGKSTLMNELIGERVSIITSKAQTTRHRILGVISGVDYQIVFSDTPGVINPEYKLQDSMMNFVYSAFQYADVLIYMIEVGEKGLKDQRLFERLKITPIPVLFLVI